jgi:hypothetical protein
MSKINILIPDVVDNRFMVSELDQVVFDPGVISPILVVLNVQIFDFVFAPIERFDYLNFVAFKIEALLINARQKSKNETPTHLQRRVTCNRCV